jgi:4-oxalomesaconate tautomerase
MGMGTVSEAVVPKISLISRPRVGGTFCTRNLIPVRCHASIGVFAAVSIATACVLPGYPANGLAVLPTGKVKRLEIEHPTGSFSVRLEMGGTEKAPVVERGGLVRTARAIFDGVVFPRTHQACDEPGSE